MGRVVVTGHRGYIGTVLVPMLVRAGHDVVGLDSELFAGSAFYDTALSVTERRKDIRDVELTDVEGFDAVVHLAGLSNDPLGDLSPDLTAEINHQASVRLARLVKRAGVPRFIFASSCSNYGGSDNWCDETSPLMPLTPYAQSKCDVERDVSTMADSSFSPVFLRNATAFGLSPMMRFDLVVNNLVAWAVSTGEVLLKSRGLAWRPLVHVEDIARSILAVVESDQARIHNRVFNVGSDRENHRVVNIAEKVAAAVDGSVVSTARTAKTDARSYRVSCQRFHGTFPEHRPQWSLDDGIAQIVKACRSSAVSPDEFEGTRYQRLRHLQHLMDSGRIDESLRWRTARSACA